MVEHQHVVGPTVAIEIYATHGMGFVATLEQVQGKEAPVFPWQPLELREIIQPGVVQGERPRLELPALVAESKDLAGNLKELHETIGEIGYYLIGLHAAAALFHHHILKDNTLTRMLLNRK